MRRPLVNMTARGAVPLVGAAVMLTVVPLACLTPVPLLGARETVLHLLHTKGISCAEDEVEGLTVPGDQLEVQRVWKACCAESLPIASEDVPAPRFRCHVRNDSLWVPSALGEGGASTVKADDRVREAEIPWTSEATLV